MASRMRLVALVLTVFFAGVARAQMPAFPDGDVNGDNKVDSADLELLSKFVTQDLVPTTLQSYRGDVAPMGKPPGLEPHVLDAADLLVLTKALETQASGATADVDGDGLSWTDEKTRGTNPFSADTDGDGMSDGAEVAAGRDPLVADQDHDGFDGTDNCPWTYNPSQADADHDGKGNACECGDINGDGIVDTSPTGPDANALTLYLNTHHVTDTRNYEGGSQDAPATCDLTGDDVCNQADLDFLTTHTATFIKLNVNGCADMRRRPLPQNATAYKEWIATNYVGDLRAFQPTPPAWNETLVNSGNHDSGKGFFWLRSPTSWINTSVDPNAAPGMDPGEPAMPIWQLLDALDRAQGFSTHEFMQQRGLFSDFAGASEYQESIHVAPAGARAFFNDHGLERDLNNACVLVDFETQIALDANCVPLSPPPAGLYQSDYITNQNAPRWSTFTENGWNRSALMANGISQDNLGGPVHRIGKEEQGRFDRFDIQRFMKWLGQTGRLSGILDPNLPGTAPLVNYINGQGPLKADILTTQSPPDWGTSQAASRRIMDNYPVMDEYQLFRHASYLHDQVRYYRSTKRVSSGRPVSSQGWDMHGNSGGVEAGSVLGSDFADSVWWEDGWTALQRIVALKISDTWGPLRLAVGAAEARGRKPMMFIPPFGNEYQPVVPVEIKVSNVHPRILELEWEELSAGGAVLMEHVGGYEGDPNNTNNPPRPDVLQRYSSYLALREQNRAVYESKGKRRYTDVALVYSVPSWIYSQYKAGSELEYGNDLNGAARALEENHVPYDVVIFDHEDLSQDRVNLADLRKYKVLVMPSVSDISARHVCLLKRYLDGGADNCPNSSSTGSTTNFGSLVVVGKFGTRDHLHATRPTDLWTELQVAPFMSRTARPLGTTGAPPVPRDFLDNYQPANNNPTRDAELASFFASVDGFIGAGKLLQVQTSAGDSTPYKMLWTKTWTHARDPKSDPNTIDLLSVHFVRYDMTLAPRTGGGFDGSQAPTFPTAYPAGTKVIVRMPFPTTGLEAWWLAPGKAKTPITGLMSCTFPFCTVTLPIYTPPGGSDRADVDDYRVLVIGPSGKLDESNNLRRGDRYLFRARYAAERLPLAQQPVFGPIDAERTANPLQFRKDARAALALAFTNRNAAFDQAQLALLTPAADTTKRYDFGWTQTGTDSHGRTKVNTLTPYPGPAGFGWLAVNPDPSRETPIERYSKYDTTFDFDSILSDLTATPVANPALYVDTKQYSQGAKTFRVDLADGTYRFDFGLTSGWLPIGSMIRINGKPLEFDIPRNGDVTRQSYTTTISGGYADVTLGLTTGFGITSLDVAPVATAQTVDPTDPTGLRDWWISPKRANGEWSPLSETYMDPNSPSSFCSGDDIYIIANPDRTNFVRANVYPAGGLPLVDLGPPQHAEIGDVAYAVTDIWRGAPSDEYLSIGASSGAVACLNAKLVGVVPNTEGVLRDEIRVPIHLSQGRNTLVVKLNRFWERRWMFYASVFQTP